MSYILDALKKSDREYQLQRGASVIQMHYASAAMENRRARRLLMVAGSILLFGTVVGGLFHAGVLELRLPSRNASALQAGLPALPTTDPLEAAAAASADLAQAPQSSITGPAPDEFAQLAPLPAALRGRLGPSAFSLHVYSAEPSQRSIIIDNRMMREGQWVDPALFLHAITPEGVIMRGGDSYYQVSVVDDWQ